MSQEKVKKIHQIYGCIAAVLIIALGIALIMSCIAINNSGYKPFTPESIALRFQKIAVLVYVCITLILGGIILSLVLPLESQRPKSIKDSTQTLRRLKEKTSSMDDVQQKAANAEERYRLILFVATGVVFTGLLVYPIIYFTDISHFPTENMNGHIIKALCISLIPSCIGLTLCFICSILSEKSIARQIAIYRTAPSKRHNAPPVTAITQAKKHSNTLLIARCSIILIAVVFIILGINNGGMKDLLGKAIAICTECIGLG